ncbi:Peptidase S1 PA clan [Arabidopsis suecica]|uniref:Peptidase S1 PA clan n=1 Tax=Arabidopsis suecica TaxID=45249 RepID=A0A8T2B3Q0_ARASU|nr:Peptidase S1 PA clan [Arabidopsis suecica]
MTELARYLNWRLKGVDNHYLLVYQYKIYTQITPDHFLEVSGAVIHPLSYQQARNFRFPCGLAYVADPGYMLFRAGVPRHAIIKKVANEDISGLGDLVSVLSKLSRGARVPLEYMSHTDRHRKKSVLVTIDRHEWYAPPQLYTRNDSSGLWDAKPAIEPASVSPSIAIMEASSGDGSQNDFGSEAKKQRVDDESLDGIASNGSLYGSEFKSDDAMATDSTVLRDFEGATALPANASLAERAIEPALVMFEVHVPPPCSLDGVHSQHFFGTGIIIYHSSSMGLAVVDKNTVVISASDVMLSFAAFPVEIPGEVVFLHPVHNYALIAYNPSAMDPASASVIRAAELLPEPALQRGDSVYLVGLSRNLQATSRKSIVTNPCAALNIGSADSPRYRATNMEVIELDTDFGSSFSGALTDEQGRIRAIWGSFSTQVKYSSTSSEDHQFVRGIPVYAISQVLEKIITGGNGPALLINGVKRPMPLVRILEVELYPTLLSKARSFGLSDAWIQVLVKKDPVRRQVLRVKGCLAGSKAENLLEQGDMVLAVNKMPVTCFNDIEAACQTLDKGSHSDENLNLTILRQGEELELVVGTDKRDGNGTTRAINWCGCVVQDPHPAVRALGFLPEEGHGVYVTRWCHGSPAHRYGLYALQWIVEVNGKKTPDLNAFADATKELEHGQFVRICDFNYGSSECGGGASECGSCR